MADPLTMGLMAVSTMISARGEEQEGRAAQESKEFEAKTKMATGTRRAYEAKREGDIVESAARAAMAAGGGMATDPGAIEHLAKIKSQAEYSALSALYEGKTGAGIARYEGRVKRKASKTRALSTVLGGGAKIYSSYKNQ